MNQILLSKMLKVEKKIENNTEYVINNFKKLDKKSLILWNLTQIKFQL